MDYQPKKPNSERSERSITSIDYGPSTINQKI